jgi:hypothetical protein
MPCWPLLKRLFSPLFLFCLFFQGYGFCEWMDPSVTEKACEGLNGMNLLGKTLTVRRAQPGSGGGGEPCLSLHWWWRWW